MNKVIICLILSMIVGSLFFSLINAEQLETLKDGKINENYVILQTCNGASYINISISNSNGLVLVNKQMINNGSVWTYNFTPTVLSRYDISYISDGCEKSGASYFMVTDSGENFDNSNGVIFGEIGLIGLLLVLGFSFSKEKWKIRTFFFMSSILMGVIMLNSIRIMAGSSNTLSKMALVGMILMIAILSFMFCWLLINYTIEIINKLKQKKENRWNPN